MVIDKNKDDYCIYYMFLLFVNIGEGYDEGKVKLVADNLFNGKNGLPKVEFRSILEINDYEMNRSNDISYMERVESVYMFFENILAPKKLLTLSQDKNNKDLVESIKYWMGLRGKEKSDNVVNIVDEFSEFEGKVGGILLQQDVDGSSNK
jgi:hypothetical protein